MAGNPRKNTPGSNHSEGGTQRSAKQKDPPIFTNDTPFPTDKTPLVKFQTWFLLLKKKFQSNADHFATDDKKIIYIIGHLGGTASDNLLPFIEEDENGKPILTTSQAVIDYLDESYKNHHAKDKTNELFDFLKMTKGQDFPVFKLEFVKLAGMSRKVKSTWKKELFKRLLDRLNSISFDKKDDDLMKAKKDKPDAAKAPNNNNTLPGPRLPQPIPGGNGNRGSPEPVDHHGIAVAGTASNGKKMYAKPSYDQTQSLIPKGQYFICYEPGHRSPECDLKAKYKKIEEARIRAIMRAAHASNAYKLSEEEVKD
ncbi:Uu.00g114900.m01.CDS01 [Anthostomella pinea]|uniref:Uu.00g114900.m01.CDS01 n=1 Tax=Anthostomella pinea TaxID=933095 RepID=A0AAI8YGP9_9PEZI|nr:Uu.00g114900.m01.CDS01 [Anthostomella pinea]